MEIEIQLTGSPIADRMLPPSSGASGAWLEFRGVVRGEENGQLIAALEYEAYPEMAEREIRRLLEDLAASQPCLAARVIHRVARHGWLAARSSSSRRISRSAISG